MKRRRLLVVRKGVTYNQVKAFNAAIACREQPIERFQLEKDRRKLLSCCRISTSSRRCRDQRCPDGDALRGDQYRRQILQPLLSCCEHLAELRLSLGCDSFDEGFEKLIYAFTKLRDTDEWQARIIGGMARFDFVPTSVGQLRRINAHIHILCALRSKRLPTRKRIESDWKQLISPFGGSVRQFRITFRSRPDWRRQGEEFWPRAWYVLYRDHTEWLRFSPRLFGDLMLFLRGKRTVRTFGRWHGRSGDGCVLRRRGAKR